VTRAVRDEADLEVVPAQHLEHGLHVLVEVEVVVLLPLALDRAGACGGALALAAHAADDPLGEGRPDLVVVLELRMALHVCERPRARLLVERRFEPQAELLAAPAVAVRTELRPRAEEREVDVEEDRANAHAGAGHLYALGRRLASDGSL